MASNINHPGVDTASTGWAEGQTGIKTTPTHLGPGHDGGDHFVSSVDSH